MYLKTHNNYSKILTHDHVAIVWSRGFARANGIAVILSLSQTATYLQHFAFQSAIGNLVSLSHFGHEKTILNNKHDITNKQIPAT